MLSISSSCVHLYCLVPNVDSGSAEWVLVASADSTAESLLLQCYGSMFLLNTVSSAGIMMPRSLTLYLADTGAHHMQFLNWLNAHSVQLLTMGFLLAMLLLKEPYSVAVILLPYANLAHVTVLNDLSV